MQKVTTDHNEIREWVRKHQGVPEVIEHGARHENDPGIRIDFPGEKDDQYLSNAHLPEQLNWENFFRIFEHEKLVFIYDDENFQKDPSMSYRFAKR